MGTHFSSSSHFLRITIFFFFSIKLSLYDCWSLFLLTRWRDKTLVFLCFTYPVKFFSLHFTRFQQAINPTLHFCFDRTCWLRSGFAVKWDTRCGWDPRWRWRSASCEEKKGTQRKQGKQEAKTQEKKQKAKRRDRWWCFMILTVEVTLFTSLVG